jgi:hypothetical protein
MATWIQLFLVSITSIGASSGFWAFLQHRGSAKDANDKLLMGLAYAKIVQLGLQYIDQGWISSDEYEEFQKYLYEPYKALGGNGVAERIMVEVTALPMRSAIRYSQIANASRTHRTGGNAQQ